MIVAPDAAAAARTAAREIASACASAIARRGRAVVAFSGGQTPWHMLEHLRTLPLDWPHVHVTQVDERIAPPGDARRNLARLAPLLLQDDVLPPANLHAMPVHELDLTRAASRYQSELEELAGTPCRLDLVQLGLGADGHTASLFVGDDTLAIDERDVAISRAYEGLPRMTLTRAAIDRARARLWLVTGTGKRDALSALVLGLGDSPAARITRSCSTVVTESAAVAPAVEQWMTRERLN